MQGLLKRILCNFNSCKIKSKKISNFYYNTVISSKLFNILLVTYLFAIFLTLIPFSKGAKIGPFINHYEPVFYDSSNLLLEHRRFKRDLTDKERDDINVHFFSHGRDFRLKLRTENQLFHPDAIIENSDGGVIKYDTNKIIQGKLLDQKNSKVHGVIDSNGFFDGHITTSDGKQFYVEPISRFGSHAPNDSQGIIYHTDDINWPTQSNCASHKLHLLRKEDKINNKNSLSNSYDFANLTIINKKSYLKPNVRRKRYVIDQRKKTCMLYLQADHLFYEHFGSEEATIDIMTRHIQRLNEIYRRTDFDMDGRPDDINFMIKRVKVHTSNRTKDPNYSYNGDFPVIKFLELFSEGDYDNFCLAYMFTFRDFEGGTLGLAWTGDLKNAGGVCERKGHFRGGIKSLNTGIITLLNYGKAVPLAVSHVTLAHEIGHNFGSPHDSESDSNCTPAGSDGNYIMFARATAGDKRNNNKFSPCSIKSILPVLNYKARDRHGCFTEPQFSICGNGVVEEGEECDCGWEEDCKESCCFPMTVRPTLKWETPCRLRPGKACSPSQGPCCTMECNVKTKEKCRDSNGCRDSAYCDGLGPHCPKSFQKPNKTICEKDSVCFMGECTGSLCLAYGLESCQCNSKRQYCDLCCKLPGEDQPCISSYEWETDPYDVPSTYAKAGSPCKNYTGYCDSYQHCREIDPSGPLATLRKLLLADEGLAEIAAWIDDHWYAVISFIVLLIIVMIVTAKYCGKRATARLRKLTVMHSNIQAIEIQRDYLDENGQIVHHPIAVRKKIPFQKKVRERRMKKSRKQRERQEGRSATNNNSSSNNVRNRGSNGVINSVSVPIVKSGKNSLWRKRKGQRSKISSSNKKEKKSENETIAPSAPPDPTSTTVLLTNNPLIDQINHIQEPSTSSSSSTNANIASSSPPSSNTVKHEHESKNIIIPLAKDKKRQQPRKKGTQNKPAASSSNPKKLKEKEETVAKKSKSKTKRKVIKYDNEVEKSKSKIPNKEESSTSKSNNGNSNSNSNKASASSISISNNTSKPAPSSTKKNIQVIYTAPFSVKVQMVENPVNRDDKIKKKKENESVHAKRRENGGSTSKSANNKKSPSSSNDLINLNSQSNTQSQEQNQNPNPKSNAKKGNSSSSNNIPESASGALKPSKSSILGHTRKTNLAKKRKSQSAELRVLIPKNNEEDYLISPITPFT